MFTQKFRAPNGVDVISITWREGYYGAHALVVGGLQRSKLNDAGKAWADNACGQRMAEIGEHAEEPK